jgi:hypothetical protein
VGTFKVPACCALGKSAPLSLAGRSAASGSCSVARVIATDVRCTWLSAVHYELPRNLSSETAVSGQGYSNRRRWSQSCRRAERKDSLELHVFFVLVPGWMCVSGLSLVRPGAGGDRLSYGRRSISSPQYVSSRACHPWSWSFVISPVVFFV